MKWPIVRDIGTSDIPATSRVAHLWNTTWIVGATTIFGMACGLPTAVDPLDDTELGGPPAEIVRTFSDDERTSATSMEQSADSGTDPRGSIADKSPEEGKEGGISTSGSKSSGNKDFELFWTTIYSNPGTNGFGNGNGNPGTNGNNGQGQRIALADAATCSLAGSGPTATITKTGKYNLASDTVVVLALDSDDRSVSVSINESTKGKGPRGICVLPSGDNTALKLALNVNVGGIYVNTKGTRSNITITVNEGRVVEGITGLLEGVDSHLVVKGPGLFKCGLITLAAGQTSSDCGQK